MNRTIALFLALAVLLAHVLAIYATASGELGKPWDIAEVAYRVGRNLVQSGTFAWNPDAPAVESYPSFLWVGVSAFGERFFTVTRFAQWIGIGSALATVLVVSKFSPGRLAGVIAPVLFVVSGSIAAAAGSGTELTLTCFLVTLSFLCFERGSRRLLAVSLTLTALARTEGVIFVGALFVLEFLRGRAAGASRTRFLPFLLPALALLAAALVRKAAFGTFLSPAGAEFLRFDRERVISGLWALDDFLISTGAPLLILVPLWYALRGVLSGLGARALALSLLWCVVAAWEGASSLPFGAQMVPILAVWFVAVQEGMTVALDSKRRLLPKFAWGLCIAGIAVSALASKYPGDLVLIPTDALHRRWMQAHSSGRFVAERSLGRLGLAEELESSAQLRAFGRYLRDQVDPTETVLCVAPGAIGYLSRLHVTDLLGRATPAPGSGEMRPWTAVPQADVVAALEEKPGFIVPAFSTSGTAPTLNATTNAWAEQLDIRPHDEERSELIKRKLEDYELVTFMLDQSEGQRAQRGYLLRRCDLGVTPVLFSSYDKGRVKISVRLRAHKQLVDLRVQLIDRDDKEWSVRPDGTIVESSDALARTAILLHRTGERAIDLIEFDLPPDGRFKGVYAQLRNPGAVGDDKFAKVGARMALPR